MFIPVTTFWKWLNRHYWGRTKFPNIIFSRKKFWLFAVRLILYIHHFRMIKLLKACSDYFLFVAWVTFRLFGMYDGVNLVIDKNQYWGRMAVCQRTSFHYYLLPTSYEGNVMVGPWEITDNIPELQDHSQPIIPSTYRGSVCESAVPPHQPLHLPVLLCVSQPEHDRCLHLLF